jgi:DNA primase
MILESSIQQVMNRADIIEVVGQFVRLKKRGANYIANCPFHNEKTPSFSVSASKGIYKCFGCGKGGNVVTFIQDHEKLTYPEAIRWLADFYKIELEETERTPEQKQQQQVEESLRILNEYAASFFERALQSEEGLAVGMSYFKQRGFSKQTIEKFRLGWGPENGDAFYTEAVAKGHSVELMEKAGLVRQRNGSYFDMYRGRVIFPIQSMTGRVLGFGARILKSNDRAPKYINSPENELYIKSRVLYGMYQSRQAIGKLDECFLVEGYTDVISLHQGGVENVVASSGTSLTEDQLRLIGQLTKNLTILYDGDPAGIKAALRGLDMALSRSFNVQLVLLPEGEDPDSFIQRVGAEQFHDYVKKHKQDVIGFRLEVGMRDVGNDPVKKSKLVNEVAESISRINKAEDFALQEHYIREAARKLQVEEAGLINLVNKFIRDRLDQEQRQRRNQETAAAAPEVPETAPASVEPQLQPAAAVHERQEWELVRVLVEYGYMPFEGFPSVADHIAERIDPELIDTPLAREVFDAYFAYRERHGLVPELNYFTGYPDPRVQQKMATLLHTGIEISPKWKENYGIDTISRELNYVNEVNSACSYFELKKLKVIQAEILSRLQQEQDPDRLVLLVRKQLEMKQQEAEILRHMGTVIWKQ